MRGFEALPKRQFVTESININSLAYHHIWSTIKTLPKLTFAGDKAPSFAARGPQDLPMQPGSASVQARATSQFGVQLLSVAITTGWTVLASYVILRVISLVIGLRVDQQDEIEGLDLS